MAAPSPAAISSSMIDTSSDAPRAASLRRLVCASLLTLPSAPGFCLAPDPSGFRSGAKKSLLSSSSAGNCAPVSEVGFGLRTLDALPLAPLSVLPLRLSVLRQADQLDQYE